VATVMADGAEVTLTAIAWMRDPAPHHARSVAS
jgi:hypothetical protein